MKTVDKMEQIELSTFIICPLCQTVNGLIGYQEKACQCKTSDKKEKIKENSKKGNIKV